MTTAIVGLVLLIGVVLWAVRVGQKSAEHSILKSTIKKLANINKFNRKEDEEVERQIKSAGDNPNPVSAPWLRRR
mgnify:CR=1 FL=1|tara:strand:+ start:938 stop:1162 length:225 start_codon:yes stop_codon:yes gene_type:complete